MPENPKETDESLDVRTIRHLVRLMKRYDLTAIDFIEGETKIRLRRAARKPSRRRLPRTVHAAAPLRPSVAPAAPRHRAPPQPVAARPES